MINIKKGDYGIKVIVNHNSEKPVYYSIDGSPLLPLVDNQYLILNEGDLTIKGEHTIKFISKDDSSSITSIDEFKYQVVN